MRHKERDAALLLDMLTAARNVTAFAAGKTFEDYAGDALLRSAIERQIEIIGEAARGVTDGVKNNFPEIPWRGIVAQRHVLAHDYGQIHHDRLWDVVTVHLPVLITQLEGLIPPQPED
jgi:uncharacterized protein with HEPN domain